MRLHDLLLARLAHAKRGLYLAAVALSHDDEVLHAMPDRMLRQLSRDILRASAEVEEAQQQLDRYKVART
ncbi:hypothetical protein [Belnapia moabensis]|uniref:hypothetical protein n=1 Tax=Belnapia moabensis TaxID=365533 RepID=UPI0005BBDC1C|nr:hypothetical protein [Belnapia moabensis]